MAIHKKGTNMHITVVTDYNLVVGGKLEKIASEVYIEAKKRNLTLISNKKIVSDGNKH